MSSGFTFIDLIFILALGLYVITRFLAHKLPKDDPSKKRPNSMREVLMSDLEEATETVPPAPKAAAPKPMADVSGLAGIDLVKAADPSFDETGFLDGAQQAYRMFYDALNTQDEVVLKQLLAPRLEKRFLLNIKQLQQQGQRQRFKVAEIKDAQLVKARVNGRTVIIDVAYTAQVQESLVDAQDKIIKGDNSPKKRQEVFVWARSVDAEDPNWELEDIQAVN